MNCETKYEKFDVKNLTVGQKVIFKPALTFLQIGASIYLSELLKPVILPVLLISMTIVLLVVFKAKKQSPEYSAEQSQKQVFVCAPVENNSYNRPVEFTRN